MNSLVQSLAAPESVAASEPVFFFGTEWLNVSGPISEILLLAAWQGVMIAAVTAVVLALLRHARPLWRYATATTALVFLTVLPVLTWTIASAPSAPLQPPPAPSVAPGATTAPVFPLPRTLAPSPVSAPSAEPVTAAPSLTASFTETLRSGWGTLVDATVPAPVVGSAASLRAWGEETAPWWAAIWLAGVAVSMIYVVVGLWWMRSIRHAATPLPESLRPLVVSAAHQAGTRTGISVKQSRRIDVPLVSGWLSPVVLLPARLVEEAPKEEVEALLIHELTHVRRHDVPVGWLQAGTEALLFFHPAAWWLSRQVRREREHGTDDQVTNAGVSPVTYAQALTRVAESVVDARPAPRVSLAPAASDGELLHRIRRMVTDTPEPVRRGSLLVATLALLVVPVLLTACSSGENATEAPSVAAAHEPPDAPPVPKESPNVIIPRSSDGDTTRVRSFRLGTDEEDSVSVRSVRIQNGRVWLNDRLIADSTWGAASDSSFTYRLDMGDFFTDVDTAAFKESMRELRFELKRLPEDVQRLRNDSTSTILGLHARAMDSLRISVDSLMGSRLSPDSLSALVGRSLRLGDSLSIVLPERATGSFERGLAPEVFRFEMGATDEVRIFRDGASTAEEMREAAERLRREAERMEERARELEKEQGDGGGK